MNLLVANYISVQQYKTDITFQDYINNIKTDLEIYSCKNINITIKNEIVTIRFDKIEYFSEIRKFGGMPKTHKIFISEALLYRLYLNNVKPIDYNSIISK